MGDRIFGRLSDGVIVELVRTRHRHGWRYAILDGEPLVLDLADTDGTLFHTVIKRRLVRLVDGATG